MRFAVGGWLGASALLTIVVVWQDTGALHDLSYLLVAFAAVAAAWLLANRWHGRDRLVARLIAAALAATAIGDLISMGIGWRAGVEPDASLADVGWLASYLGVGAALLLIMRRDRGQRGRDLDGLIDVAAVFVAGMVVIGEIAVAATVADEAVPLAIGILWGTYPVMDVALLALAVPVAVRLRTLGPALITAAAAGWLAADVAYLAIADAADYEPWLDAGWLAGMVLFALAVLVGPRAGPRLVRQRPALQPNEVGIGRVLVALVPLLVPSAMGLVGFWQGQEPNPVMIMTGTLVLVLLAFIRMARLSWSVRRAGTALRSKERYARALAANSADAVAVLDAELRLVDNFPGLAELVGHSGKDTTGCDALALVVPDDIDEVSAAVRRCMASPGQFFELELRVRHRDGRWIWLGARVTNLLHDPNVRGVVANLRDISDRKDAERELAHQAFHDALTGLSNRALFRDRLEQALQRGLASGSHPAVIFLDLDAFKTVNDSLGHDVGDDLLREVAARLTAAVRRGDTVARLGGDEFAVLIDGGRQPLNEAVTVAGRLLTMLREPMHLRGFTVAVSASLGIAVADGTTGATSLLRDADVAMYRAKATGKDRWIVYHSGMRTAALERLELETGMHAALDQGEFRLVYQPIVSLADETVVGLEALLRWHHPSYGQLDPERFIPLAEETGLIVPIGRWVLSEATRTAAGWQRQFPDRPLSIAVNISGRQLTASDLVRDVRRVLAESGLAAGDLVLDMTETVLVRDPAIAASRLAALDQQGVSLAIDDFGTGYSSLSYLRKFPVNILKIDRAFVSSMSTPEHSPAILRGLIDLGHTLGLTTVAEGVESEFQRDRLREQGCDLAQGMLFGAPMTGEQVAEMLAATPQVQASSAGAGS